MSDWEKRASERRDYRRVAVQDVQPRHRKKTERPKNWGIACYSLNPHWDRLHQTPWIRWFEKERDRDQAFRVLVKRTRFRSHWRVTMDDYIAVREAVNGIDTLHVE